MAEDDLEPSVETEETGPPAEAQPLETAQDEAPIDSSAEVANEVPFEYPTEAPLEDATGVPAGEERAAASDSQETPLEPPPEDLTVEAPAEASEELPRRLSEKAITFELGAEEPLEQRIPSLSKSDTGSATKVKNVITSEALAGRTSATRLSKQQSDIIGKSKLSSSASIGKVSAVKASQSETARRRSERLGSKARQVVGSVLSIRRLSAVGEYYDRKSTRYMNTYKLESEKAFNPEKVQKILEAVMTEALEGLTYDPVKCPKQAKWASSAIRAKLKEQEFDRYKLICLVTIGEKNSQDVLVTCRFLWDAERDRYATFALENSHVYGIAQCFGLYYE